MSLPLAVADLAVTGEGGRCLLSVDALALAPGRCLGVRGPSGAGKSTLLYALAGLLPAKGSARWGEIDILALRPGERARFRRQHMGLVFQDFLLFEELSAAENAAIAAAFRPRGERADLRTAARTQLAALGVPQGTRRAQTYSGGERQRIGVARALAHGPAVILADEPTASLDRTAADALIGDLVARVREGGTSLIAVSHDTHLLSQMDAVLTLDRGEVVDTATEAA